MDSQTALLASRLKEGGTTAVVGLNASGKTRLAENLRRQIASDGLRYMSFCDTYGTAADRAYYLQQRWNQHDISEETPRVGQAIERAYAMTGEDTTERRLWRQELCAMMGLEPLMDSFTISLSSGELRKLQLAKVLMSKPRMLVLDNPFIGLDANTRSMLALLLEKLASESGIALCLLLSRTGEVPAFTDCTILTSPEAVLSDAPRGLGAAGIEALKALTPDAASTESAKAPLPNLAVDESGDDVVVKLNDVSIRYEQRTILSHLSWQVSRGECWALQGSNGSGKSTLLSLICADNPQAYACDITLFGRRRGSGESIWDIKRRIGYVSPELARSYQRQIPTLRVVASGLKDTVGLYARCNEEEKEQCRWWMRLFGIEQLADRMFTSLSSGEQRLALVARAFVKDPQLLILDEPMHGLDSYNSQVVKDAINAFCSRPGKTLIMVSHYEEELPECITHRLRLG
ncbi:MAG: ATP-binding cassette domain-containing protein [Prevotella sp.]|nr:ATP-binding cassette domain-containing protein [Prevotella sp.]